MMRACYKCLVHSLGEGNILVITPLLPRIQECIRIYYNINLICRYTCGRLKLMNGRSMADRDVHEMPETIKWQDNYSKTLMTL